MNILVAYDGTHVGRQALELAKKRAQVLGAKIAVVNCMAQNNKLKYEDIQKAEEKLEGEVRSILNSEKIPYETLLMICSQDSGKELVGYAERSKADEIIVGIQKRTKVGKLVFGSTAQYVILNAPCPVIAVK